MQLCWNIGRAAHQDQKKRHQVHDNSDDIYGVADDSSTDDTAIANKFDTPAIAT